MNNTITYDKMAELIDNMIVTLWGEYTPTDVNELILRLIINHGVYLNVQPYYLDYLIDDLEKLKGDDKNE